MGNAMGGGVRDGVRGFVSRTGPDSQLSVRLAQDEQLLRSLKAAGTDIDDCLKWIELAKGRLQGGPIRRYFDYDVAWACILRVRHRLCSLLPIDQLYRVAIDVGNDLSYIRDPQERQREVLRLEKIAPFLGPSSASSKDEQRRPSDQEVRYELARLSIIAAEHREETWQKVNLLRMRLVITSCILALLLLISLFTLSSLFKEASALFFAVVLLFGGMGGLLSALQTREPMTLNATQYYVQRTLLYLRPIVGATAGLVLTIVQISGVVTVLPAVTGVAPAVYSLTSVTTAIHLAIAFLGGFSERFFLSRLDPLKGGVEDSTSRNEERPAATQTGRTPAAGE